ncbi:MAG: trimethylamine methyltransferase family protein [Chloroflexi bacterium]|nr:trimethylamine methyltransferase family protein [Chloroflexota bacterium]
MKVGLQGGLLSVLSDGDLERIHDSSLRILEECGVRCDSGAILRIFQRGGARVDADTRMVRIPRDLVQWAIASAPRSFVFCGRDPAFDLLLEQRRVYYGLGGSAVPYFWDSDRQVLRPPVEADVVAATRVGHTLANVDFIMSLAAAGDCPPELHYLYEYNAILRHTTKPVIYSAPSREFAAIFLEMAAAASGGEGELRRRPSVMLFTQPVSPLQMADYNEGMIEFAACGAPVLYSPGVMMGATGPATLAGALAQGNAENLVGVVLSQLLKPGTPIVYGPHTPVMDMSTLRCSYAGTEQALARAGMAQLARFYGLPSFNTGAGCDSKVVDAQAAAEASMGIFLNTLAGLTLTQTMGTMAGGTFGSLEMLVICDEIVAMAKRILRGIEVSDETLAVDVIKEVGPGGHFLESEHTLRTFRQEFFFPQLFDRRSIADWQTRRGVPVDVVARARVRQILSEPALLARPASVERALDECMMSHVLRRQEALPKPEVIDGGHPKQ